MVTAATASSAAAVSIPLLRGEAGGDGHRASRPGNGVQGVRQRLEWLPAEVPATGLPLPALSAVGGRREGRRRAELRAAEAVDLRHGDAVHDAGQTGPNGR